MSTRTRTTRKQKTTIDPNLAARRKEILDVARALGSQRNLAEAIGMDHTRISKSLSDAKITDRRLLPIEMAIERLGLTEKSRLYKTGGKRKQLETIPLLRFGSDMGELYHEHVRDQHLLVPMDMLPSARDRTGGLYAMQMPSSAMSPTVDVGDYLIFQMDENAALYDGNIIIVKRPDTAGVSIYRISYGGANITLISDNTRLQTNSFELPMDEFKKWEIVGKVVVIWKRLA